MGSSSNIIKRSCLAWSLFLLFVFSLDAQQDNYSFNISSLAGYTSSGTIPFWMRSNQFGSIPVSGASFSLIGSARKDYDNSKHRIFDWGASFEARGNLGQKSNFTIIEGYGKLKLSIFEFKAGRVKDIMGLCDTTLSSGSFSVSGNAPGIPKVQVAIPEFYSIPWFGKLFAFKGIYNHGWLGNVPMRRLITDDTVGINSFLHQKALYGRFGKPEWKWKLYGGFNHQVTWGNEQTFYVQDFTLSTFQTYLYVITGKKYSTGIIQETRLGNHIGSIDVGFDYRFDKVKLLVYRQNFYEAGALIHLANINDGLNGVSLEFKQKEDQMFRLKKLLIEFLYSKNQAGEATSKFTTSPYEPYYNHGHYMQGWSYHGIGLGTPFITTADYVREGLPSAPGEYFINNRVSVLHIGLEGSIEKCNYLLKASFSENYGTYYTTDEEQSTDIPDPGAYGIFGQREQFSAYLDCSRELKSGLNFGCTAAFDVGELYYNSFGLIVRLSKSF